jgi:hypothetical protein
MAQHTPGPWRCGQGITEKITPVVWAGSLVFGERIVHRIAVCDNAANARLIAAAPELLDALEELVSDLEFDMSAGCNPRLVKSGKRIEYARAAISKATGESA